MYNNNNMYNFISYQAIKYVLRLQTKKMGGKGGKMALLVKKVGDPRSKLSYLTFRQLSHKGMSRSSVTQMPIYL